MSYGFAQAFGQAAPLGSAGAIGHGWNTLPLGCGGLVTGLHIASDGTMVCRTDVGNIYRWSGTTADYADVTKKWLPLLSNNSLPGQGPSGGLAKVIEVPGGWEHVLAPTLSSVHVAIFESMDLGPPAQYRVWYSTNSGVTWNKSNLVLNNANSNGGYDKNSYYKIAIDPFNANVAYCGMPVSSGNAAGAYTTFNQSGGSTLATWTSVKTSGSTPVGGCTNTISCGIVVDASKGINTIGGDVVAKHIIIPVGGVGIYESCDSGVTFVECAATAMGTGNFFVTNGGCNFAGVYFCVVVHATAGGVWRYVNATTTAGAGTWTKLTTAGVSWLPSDFQIGTYLIIDPRNNAISKAYLSVTGPNGLGNGFTATNADTAAAGAVNWQGRTDGQYPYLSAASYDIGYANDLFGQQKINAFGGGPAAIIDRTTGVCFWGGNQSFFYMSDSATIPTPRVGGPSYANPGGSNGPSFFDATTSGLSTTVVLSNPGGAVVSLGSVISGRGDPLDPTGSMPGTGVIPPGTTLVSQSSGTAGLAGTYVMSNAANLVGIKTIVNATVTNHWSMGRGMEVTVAQDALCSPGGTFPILAAQDVGCPMRGTFTTYPLTMAVRFHEYTNSHIEYAASDPSFIVSRATDQAGDFIDASCFSTNYGADGTWTQFPSTPTGLWQASITATVSNGSGGAGNILNVTAKTGGQILPTAQICTGAHGGQIVASQDLYVAPYGTSGTTGAGGTGTYILFKDAIGTAGSASVLTPTSLFSVMPIHAGQLVAVDSQHMLTCPIGLYGPGQWFIPAYTTNQGVSWQLCSGLSPSPWMTRPWTFGATTRPFAVGYGTDLGTVWGCLFTGAGTGTGLAKLYRSTDSGASFSLVASWDITDSYLGCYCLAVPGKPDELWISGEFSTVTAPTYTNAGIWHITGARTSGTPTVTKVNIPASPLINVAVNFTLGAPAAAGSYPALYLQGRDPYSGTEPNKTYLFEGSYPGTGAVVTWSLFGPTGTDQDLPPICQLKGLQSIRGDWNTYRRLYVASYTGGLAYYNP